MSCTIEQAKKLIKAEERKQRQAKEALRNQENQRIIDGWKTAKVKIIPITERYHFNKTMLPGWRVTERNSYNHEWRGMSYVITKENVIMSTGGGTCILQANIILTKEEIESLNNSIIPKRIRHRNDYPY